MNFQKNRFQEEQIYVSFGKAPLSTHNSRENDLDVNIIVITIFNIVIVVNIFILIKDLNK